MTLCILSCIASFLIGILIGIIGIYQFLEKENRQ